VAVQVVCQVALRGNMGDMATWGDDMWHNCIGGKGHVKGIQTHDSNK